MEITKEDILKLIEVEKRDTFCNHFLNVVFKDYCSKGEVKSDEVRVWQQSFWNRITYPVFIFTLDSKNNLIEITERVNPVGRIYNIILVAISLIYIFSLFYESSLNVKDNWLVILMILIFLSTIIFVLVKYYQFEKQQQLNKILEILEIEVDEEKTEKEWSMKNIFIRLFTYPFCLFLVGINIFLLIPEGQYILALFSFGFVVFYLVADLKTILRKNIK